MTSPALPGAAPDPARLPPEVESCIEFCRSMAIPQGHPCWDALRTAIRAALGKRGEVSAASAASARALGGDGEPVAWAVERINDGVLCDISRHRAPLDRDWAGPEGHRFRVVPLYTRPAATGDTTDDACPHHSETGLGGCGRFAWHCDGCGRIRWIYDASKGIGSRADVPRGVVLEGPPTTAVEIARRMLTLGDVALLLERAGSSDDEQGSARRTLLRLEALRNALAAEATRAATGGPDAR